MRKAGLGDMYRQRPTAAVKAIENFTTAALAVAINQDPQPLLRALALVADWKPDLVARRDAGTLLVDLDDLRSAEAAVQVYLEKTTEADRGHLDLVVTLADSRLSQEVWVEVKVDAGLNIHADPADEQDSLDQLQVYMDHRPLHRPGRPDSPFIVTLARGPSLRSDVPGFRWDDLDAAAANADGSLWVDVRAFLAEEGIVFPPLPSQLGGWEAYVSVFEGINSVVKRLWSGVVNNMHTVGVRKALEFNVKSRHEIMLTAQCLSYGLRPGPEKPEWWIAVGDGSDYQGVHVPVEAVIDAAQGGRLDSWDRLDNARRVDRFDVFEKRRPYAVESELGPIEWFAAALEEVNDSKVLEPYFEQRHSQARP